MGDFGEVTCTGDRATCEKIDSSLEKNLIALLSGLGERSGFPPRAVKQEERQVSICHAWTRLSLPTGPKAPYSSEDTSQCGPKSLRLHLLLFPAISEAVSPLCASPSETWGLLFNPNSADLRSP